MLRERADEPVLFMLRKWMDACPDLSVGFSGPSNTALHVDDDPATVIHNRKAITSALRFDFEAWTCGEQVHDNRIARVTAAERGSGRLTRASAIQATDGLTTNELDVLLTSFYADCVPLYFFDPVTRATGLAHAGWKGTVLKIAVNMVNHMETQYGTPPARLLVAIGPSIGPCCYEVDERVAEKVRKLQLPHGLVKKNDKHYDLDLKECNRQLMIKAGINPNHIEFSLLCTSCHSDLFFSHRRDQGKTGRMASWIGLRKG